MNQWRMSWSQNPPDKRDLALPPHTFTAACPPLPPAPRASPSPSSPPPAQASTSPLNIDYDEIDALFAIIESSALRRLVAQRAHEVRLVEHKRAHNICIVLAGKGGRRGGVGGGLM